MTLLCALMPLTWKEFLTDTCLTDWNLICAFSSFFTKQSEYLFATAWTEANTSRSLLAWLTLTLMAHFLAKVFSTVQHLVTNVVAHKLFASTLDLAFLFLTEALRGDLILALAAFPLMTLLLALML